MPDGPCFPGYISRSARSGAAGGATPAVPAAKAAASGAAASSDRSREREAKKGRRPVQVGEVKSEKGRSEKDSYRLPQDQLENHELKWLITRH